MQKTIKTLPSPNVLGFSDKYSSWRPQQLEAVLEILNTDKKFLSQVCPTGFGKSLSYMVAASQIGGRCVILTSTKSLQTQLANDFKNIGAVDMRGKNAYKCRMEPSTTCDKAPCTVGVTCHLREKECLYFNRYREAQTARIVITNYACYMSQKKFKGETRGDRTGLGNFDFMVCDEAHFVPGMISSFMESKINLADSYVKSRSVPQELENISSWIGWAKDCEASIKDDYSSKCSALRSDWSSNDASKLSKVASVLRAVETLCSKVTPENWVADRQGHIITFCPVWPADYAFDVLFSGTKKVLFTSATVREKTLDMIGVDEEDREITEYAHAFPLENRRLIHIPTIRVNARTTDSEYKMLVGRIDSILKTRQDRKGIVHTISYGRRDTILRMTTMQDVMLTHGNRGGEHERAVMEFKRAAPPKVLVSPSVGTGYDFPYDDCRFQIITKIPYPDTRSAIMKARCKSDSDYAPYIAMQGLVQATGRGVRAVDDYCETFVLDDNAKWFLPKYMEFAPEWFRGAYLRSTFIPKPFKKL